MSPERRRKPRGSESAAKIFAALGNKTRLGLVALLCAGGPTSIARLTEGTQVTRQAVTKHLQILADAGLVRGADAGLVRGAATARTQVWEIDPARLDEARRWLDHIEARWDETLDRLQRSLERS